MKAVFTSIHLEECEAFVKRRKGNFTIDRDMFSGRYVVYFHGLGGE